MPIAGSMQCNRDGAGARRYRAIPSQQPSFCGDWPPYPWRGTTPRRCGRLPRLAPDLQLVLPLESAHQITPLMRVVEQILVRLSQANLPMPNNPVLGERAGGHGRSAVDRALRRLAALGRIRIERGEGKRRVWVATTAKFTEWGEARKGHAPFSSRKRGEAPAARVRASGSAALPPALPKIAFQPIVVGPAHTCQWPMWADGKRATGQFCGARSVPGKSYCSEHQGVVRFRAG